MALTLAATSSVVGPNISTFCYASGGTAPYVYSVVAGGAGGTINSATGAYTAPAITGNDTVLVTDATSATATLSILIGTAIDLVMDIIQTGMGLPNGSVWLFDQKIFTPVDSNLYITVGVLNCKPFGNSSQPDGNGNEILSVNMLATLSVDIISRSTAALYQKEQVLMALRSQYSQTQQDSNSFYIASLPTGFVNLSDIDGAAIPYRFNFSFQIQYFSTMTKPISYYNQTQGPVVVTNP